jgi:orotate phosphoribosyltransferase
MTAPAPAIDLLHLLPARQGHFLLESGHHGQLWLEMPALCLRPERVKPLASALAERLRAHAVQIVCGPLVEGAFVALMVAEALGLPFTYAQPHRRARTGLFPVGYEIPGPLQAALRGRRIAIVNDVINAGSAVRGTLAALQACAGVPLVIATLATLGEAPARLAADEGVALETLTALPNQIWTPETCPQCALGVPLEHPGGEPGPSSARPRPSART